MFGINLGVDQCGTLKKGDKVFVGVVPVDWAPASKKRVEPKWLMRIYMTLFGAVAAKIVAESFFKEAI